MIVSVTRLRLRSVLYLPGFFRYAIPSQRSSTHAQGFVDGRLIPETMLTFWTITRWQSEADMRAWRGSGAHGRSMSKLAAWCDEASVARWESPDDTTFPTWQDCYRRLVESGRFTPVNHPSTNQSAKQIPEPHYHNESRSMSFTRANP